MRFPVLATAALMVALPSWMLVARWVDEGSRPVSERPASFQMYSFTPAATYTGLDAQGGRRPLSVEALPLVIRAVDTGRVVPDRLCARDPSLVAVERRGGARPGVFVC